MSKTTNFQRLTMRCPHCDERSAVEESRPVTRIVRDLYFRCSNLDCGFTFKAQLCVIAEISPPAAAHPAVRLPKIPPRRRGGQVAPANDNQAEALPQRA